MHTLTKDHIFYGFTDGMLGENNTASQNSSAILHNLKMSNKIYKPVIKAYKTCRVLHYEVKIVHSET